MLLRDSDMTGQILKAHNSIGIFALMEIYMYFH